MTINSNLIFVEVSMTLDEVDALVKTVAIAKDNTARKMRENLHQPHHRAYKTAADDFKHLHSVYSCLSEKQAEALLAQGEDS